MERIQFGSFEYISMERGKLNVIFFTARNKLNFNKQNSEGLENLEMVKREFGLKEIGYLNQIHSDLIYNYDGQIHDGDALLTNKKNTGIGVFTADCVPIMLHDKAKDVIAAVHSGWKGTYFEITSKTIARMHQEYGSEPGDISVYIGPHNHQCCYEVGGEVMEKFMAKQLYDGVPVFSGRNLSMEECIRKQCRDCGVKEENISSTGICTFCSKEYEMFSYRRDSKENGRLFSLIFLKD